MAKLEGYHSRSVNLTTESNLLQFNISYAKYNCFWLMLYIGRD